MENSTDSSGSGRQRALGPGATMMDVQAEFLSADSTVKYMAAHTDGGTPVSEVRFSPENCLLPKFYHSRVNVVRNFKAREDDVWIITYPKCGTTWTQEMVWMLKNKFDFQTSREVNAYYRVPFLEYHHFHDPNSPLNAMAEASAAELLESRPSPRVIKSHLPISLLPTQLWTVRPKIIYVYRNPKDVVVSYYHHFQLLENYTGTKDEFIKAFLQGKTLYGSFWGNVLPFWNRRNEPNVQFITYEDMKKDLKKVAYKVADFIGASIPKDLEEAFFDHLSFSSMSKNPSVNFEAIINNKRFQNKKGMRFIRKGESGVWKEALTPQQVEQFDEWSKMAIEGTGFPYYS